MAASSTSTIARSASGCTCRKSSANADRRTRAASSTATPDSLLISIDMSALPQALAALGAVGELCRLASLVVARLLPGVVLGVGVDDTADERVPHDVVAREVREVDVVDIVQHTRHEP